MGMDTSPQTSTSPASSTKTSTSPGSSTKRTRTTRMIIVEEISDTDKESIDASFKSFERATKLHSQATCSSKGEAAGLLVAEPKCRVGEELLHGQGADVAGREVHEVVGRPTTNNKSRLEPGRTRSTAWGTSPKESSAEQPCSTDTLQATGTLTDKAQEESSSVFDMCGNAAGGDDEGHDSQISVLSLGGDRHATLMDPQLGGSKSQLATTSAPFRSVATSVGRTNRTFIARPPKAFHDADEMRTIEDTLLYQTLRPLFICMKASGIFFIRRNKSSATRGCRRFAENCDLLQVYSFSICLVLMGNFLRSLTAFSFSDGFNTTLFFKFLVCIFFYEAVSRSVLACWACWRRKKGIQEFFLTLEKICYPDKIIPYEEPLRRSMRALIALTFVTSLANVLVLAYGLFGPPDVREMFDAYLQPVSPDSPGVLAFQLFLLLLTFVNTQVAILSLSFFTVCCYILYKEFEYLHRTFTMKIKEDGSFVDDLERFRRCHQSRCQIVEAGDQIFKYYIANTYLTNVPLLCLLLFTIVYTENENDVAYRVISSFRLTYVLLQMIVLSVAATMINDQAHAPLSDVYSIRVQNTSSARQHEISMFLNKLTGTSVGLTAWDMFVINKPTVLMVIGMILTYFFLLVQFKNPLQGGTTCNCVFRTSNGTNISLPTF